MKLALVAASLALIATPAFAGDHGSHPPMGPPLSVICATKPINVQFLCNHPSYVLLIAAGGLSKTFSSPCHGGFVRAMPSDPGVPYGTCS